MGASCGDYSSGSRNRWCLCVCGHQALQVSDYLAAVSSPSASIVRAVYHAASCRRGCAAESHSVVDAQSSKTRTAPRLDASARLLVRENCMMELPPVRAFAKDSRSVVTLERADETETETEILSVSLQLALSAIGPGLLTLPFGMAQAGEVRRVMYGFVSLHICCRLTVLYLLVRLAAECSLHRIIWVHQRSGSYNNAQRPSVCNGPCQASQCLLLSSR